MLRLNAQKVDLSNLHVRASSNRLVKKCESVQSSDVQCEVHEVRLRFPG
jgi:hypothetical protein